MAGCVLWGNVSELTASKDSLRTEYLSRARSITTGTAVVQVAPSAHTNTPPGLAVPGLEGVAILSEVGDVVGGPTRGEHVGGDEW